MDKQDRIKNLQAELCSVRIMPHRDLSNALNALVDD